MNPIFLKIFQPASYETTQIALCFLRMSLGVLTMFHGIPKISGGLETWAKLGTFVNPLGIYFWPIFWGFLGASTEFFGGIALVIGLGTRIACLALTVMMFVATVWHINQGHDFTKYSFPLTLIFVYATYVIMGADTYSLDYLLTRQ